MALTILRNSGNLPADVWIKIFEFEEKLQIEKSELCEVVAFFKLRSFSNLVEQTDNEQDFTQKLKKTISDETDADIILYGLSQCTCCIRHSKNKPRGISDLMTNPVQSISNTVDLNEYSACDCLCSCNCRHFARLIHRRFN